MQEDEVKKVFKEALEKTEVGKPINLSLTGINTIVEVTISVDNGWKFFHTIIPGESFKMIKGKGDIDINIIFKTGAGLN